jgi:hypothetical protein
MAPRTAMQRRTDAVRRLETDPNIWIATASADGSPHLVPLSLSWDGTQIVVTTPSSMPTAVNAAASGQVRAALDSTADVVMIDATVEVFELGAVDDAVIQAYIARVGWDPRVESGAWSMLVLTPFRVQSFNGIGESVGRTIMRAGVWVD